MSIYFLLFFEFFKTGLFAVGGGLATIPFLKQISVDRGWFTLSELTDFIAISESTPGPIGVNISTYAGFKAAGIFGGVLATLSLVLPSVIIIIVVSKFLKRFKNSSLVSSVFEALRPATAGLIAGAMYEVFVMALLDLDALDGGTWLDCINMISVAVYIVIAALTVKFKKLHPIFFIAVGAAAGIIFKI